MEIKNLLEYLPVTVLDEINELTADEKIDFGHELLELGRQGLSYPNLVPFSYDLHNMSRLELMNAGIAIMYLGVKENG